MTECLINFVLISLVYWLIGKMLVEYISKEIPIGDNLYGSIWHLRFTQTKAGKCAYREKCSMYAKSKNTILIT